MEIKNNFKARSCSYLSLKPIIGRVYTYIWAPRRHTSSYLHLKSIIGRVYTLESYIWQADIFISEFQDKIPGHFHTSAIICDFVAENRWKVTILTRLGLFPKFQKLLKPHELIFSDEKINSCGNWKPLKRKLFNFEIETPKMN